MDLSLGQAIRPFKHGAETDAFSSFAAAHPDACPGSPPRPGRRQTAVDRIAWCRPKAHKRYDDLRRSIRELPQHLCRYRPNPEQVGTRILSVSDFRVIYELHPDTGRNEDAGDVLVLRVLPPGTR